MANDLDQVLQPISLHLENYCQKLNEVKNTTLDARILMLIDEIIQLFTAATNKFNGQFVDITAQAIHRAGEIIAQLRDYIKKDEDKASPRSPAKQPRMLIVPFLNIALLTLRRFVARSTCFAHQAGRYADKGAGQEHKGGRRSVAAARGRQGHGRGGVRSLCVLQRARRGGQLDGRI